MDKIIFSHVTGNMLLLFSIGVLVIFLYGQWKTDNNDLKNGYEIKKYARLTWVNFAFQFLGGFMVLFVIHEIGERIVPLIGLAAGQGYHLTLSGLCGLLGGQFLALVIEKGRMILNKRDKEIAHLERPDLDKKL